MKGLEGMGLLGLWHWCHPLRAQHILALCSCKSGSGSSVPWGGPCCHHCSPGMVGRGHTVMWDKPGLALPPSQSSGTACCPWELPRKLLWCFLNPGLWRRLSGQRSPEPLKTPYLDVHAILSFKTQTCGIFWTISKYWAFFFFFELSVAELLGLTSDGYFTSSFSCEWHLKYQHFSFDSTPW